ncbi:MAG: xanthine dehydrogenase family protein subunit M [Firmicutes bacterium]|nr:xanthine dehydrogenase family protein subunit M [Bacillota bacterium]
MLRPFDYYRPRTLSEAIKLLSETGAAALAGGTDLLVNIRSGKESPQVVVDLKDLPELHGIHLEGDKVWLGALTTMGEIVNAAAFRGPLGILSEAASVVGCCEIRRRATVGGNICNASPGADTAPALLALEAEAAIRGPGGARSMPLPAFYLGPGRTALGPGEILSGFFIPRPPEGSRGTYLRRTRVKGMDLAGIGLAALVIPGHGKRNHEVRLALGAVAPTPVRAREAEILLQDQVVDALSLTRAKEVLRRSISPRATSLRASPEYKREMAGVLLEMALSKLLGEEYAG